MNYNRNIGIHLRLDGNKIESIAQQVQLLNLSLFQFFVTAPPNHDQYLKISPAESKQFIRLTEQCDGRYIHSSYWINPSTGKSQSHSISQQLLIKEINIAQQLEVRWLVLHGGSAKGHLQTSVDPLGKHQGIQALAKMLNAVLKETSGVQILLENTAHGNHAIGSDLHDFVTLKEYLNFPERIGFCIDFAHAHSFGYNLSRPDDFAHLLNNTIGLDTIKLLHLNDTYEHFGSKKDKHAIPGLGNIGKNNLIRLINAPYFINIPKICEPPTMSFQEMQIFLNDVRTWPTSI